MAIYRNISLSFWTDNKVSDDFTYKDKYLMLYLLTNPHTNIIGCYEISYKQMSVELGLEINEVKRLVDKMQNIHKTILYSETTKEILIKNWARYNWTKSSKLHKPIIENIKLIKDLEFKKYMVSIAKRYGIDTISLGYEYPIDTTVTVTVTVTDTDSVTDYFNNLKELVNYIQDNLNYKLNNTPIEINTLNYWIDNKIPKEVIKYGFEEARRRNISDINYIQKIVINRVEELKKTNENTSSSVPDWLDKPIEKDEEGLEELEEVFKEFN